MMQRISILGVVVSMLFAVFVPLQVRASSASVFVSPSSVSVEKGKNVTLQVRVNSGTNSMDSAEARLSYDSARLSYVSHSAGDFQTFQQTVGGSSFEYVGFIPGGTSGNRALFSITLKARATGSATVSLSGVRVAAAGSDLSVSVGGGTITVTAPPPKESSDQSKPPSDTSSKPPESTFSNEAPSTAPDQADTTPPKYVQTPQLETTKSTIRVRATSDKPSFLQVRYGLVGEEKATLQSEELTKEHDVLVGEDDPLLAGRQYEIETTLIDEADATSETKKRTVKTKGVVYKVKIVDKQGVPLVNHPVELFSDPLASTTDADGVATFEDVTPGEHTLVFDIDGITIRQPVLVAETLVLASDDEVQAPAEIALPFSIATDSTQTIQNTVRWDLLLYAGLAGAMAATLLQHGPSRRIFVRIMSNIKLYRPEQVHIHPEVRPKNIDKLDHTKHT